MDEMEITPDEEKVLRSICRRHNIKTASGFAAGFGSISLLYFSENILNYLPTLMNQRQGALLVLGTIASGLLYCAYRAYNAMMGDINPDRILLSEIKREELETLNPFFERHNIKINELLANYR